jgi:hypothetical protein
MIDILLTFDTEDVFSPPELGNDDSIKELADIMSAEDLPGLFLFIGDRAALLKERGRTDVIESLKPHEVGLHTRSARHPTCPEYVAEKSWDEGLELSLADETEGVNIISDVFGRPCAALSAHNVFITPHAICCAGILDLPYVYSYPAAPPKYGLSWYAGGLALPATSPTERGDPFLGFITGFDSRYHDDDAFEAGLRRLDDRIDRCIEAGQTFLTCIMYHPQRVRLAQFIDSYFSPNGMNLPEQEWGRFGHPAQYTEEQVESNLRNFQRLCSYIRNDPRLNPVTVTGLKKQFGQQTASIQREQLIAAAKEINQQRRILFHPTFSPAEILLFMCRALLHFAEHDNLPEEISRDDVRGPRKNLIVHPERKQCTFKEFISECQTLVNEIEQSGYLPSMWGETGYRLSVNHIYGAAADRLVHIAAGETPGGFVFPNMPRYPELATAIGQRFASVAEGNLVDSDLNIDALYLHGKLQTWSLKPAEKS